MKATIKEQTIHAYSKRLEIEVEGEVCLAILNYNSWDGFELDFIDSSGKSIDWPKWADDYDTGERSLEYDLDVASENVQTMKDGELLDEIMQVINTDGELRTDGEVLEIIAGILKREGK